MLKLNPKTGEWEGTSGGVNIVELSQRQVSHKVVKTNEEKQDEIRSQVMQNPNYAYAIRLTEYVSEQLEIKLGRTVFRNRQSSCYDPQTKQIYLSYENIENSVNKGFAEYPTVAYVWIKNGYKGIQQRGFWRFDNGKKAIWMIVLHEMAHAVQHTKNGFYRGSIHNEVFMSELEELIVLFPYDEVESI